jgi:hypothetical protein
MLRIKIELIIPRLDAKSDHGVWYIEDQKFTIESQTYFFFPFFPRNYM